VQNYTDEFPNILEAFRVYRSTCNDDPVDKIFDAAREVVISGTDGGQADFNIHSTILLFSRFCKLQEPLMSYEILTDFILRVGKTFFITSLAGYESSIKSLLKIRGDLSITEMIHRFAEVVNPRYLAISSDLAIFVKPLEAFYDEFHEVEPDLDIGRILRVSYDIVMTGVGDEFEYYHLYTSALHKKLSELRKIREIPLLEIRDLANTLKHKTLKLNDLFRYITALVQEFLEHRMEDISYVLTEMKNLSDTTESRVSVLCEFRRKFNEKPQPREIASRMKELYEIFHSKNPKMCDITKKLPQLQNVMSLDEALSDYRRQFGISGSPDFIEQDVLEFFANRQAFSILFNLSFFAFTIGFAFFL